MLFDVVSIVWRLAAVSAAIAVVLHFAGTDANEVLAQIGATPADIGSWIVTGWEMALPNLILGAIIVIPLWLVTLVLRPPKR